MNKIIDGKRLSINIKQRLTDEIRTSNLSPKLAVIRVGDDEASRVYVNAKEKSCNEVGIAFSHIHYGSEVKEEDIIKKIEELNSDSEVSGILVQLPLPKGFNTNKIINTIASSKDVDGLTYTNVGKLLNNQDCLISCTPKGIIRLLDEYNVDMSGKHVVIIGRSNLVGKPLQSLFLNRDATVTMCHSKTIDLAKFTKSADILIVAVGKKHLIKSDMVKEGAIVVDVGINRENGKLYGDVDYENVFDKVSLITPVPGGVGPMTVAMLLENVLESYKKN